MTISLSLKRDDDIFLFFSFCKGFISIDQRTAEKSAASHSLGLFSRTTHACDQQESESALRIRKDGPTGSCIARHPPLTRRIGSARGFTVTLSYSEHSAANAARTAHGTKDSGSSVVVEQHQSRPASSWGGSPFSLAEADEDHRIRTG